MESSTVSLIILLICVIFFITEWIPASFTAVLGCVLMYLTGACEFSAAFSGFSSSSFFLVAGSMVVGVAMSETGTARLIARYCMKLSGGKERIFILYAAVASGILSAFIANTAVVACFMPIIESVALSGRGTRKNMTMAITFGAMYGGALTLVGSTPQPLANGILKEATGIEIGMFDFLGPGIIIFIAFLVYTQLIGYRLGIKIWGKRDENTATVLNKNPEDTDHPVNRRKVILMSAVFLWMIVSYALEIIPTEMTALVAALLCVVLRLCDERQVFKEMSWGPLIILGGTVGIAAGLNESGAGKILADFALGAVHDGQKPLFVFAIFIILTTVISNFCSNAATTLMILPLAISVCTAHGWNPVTFAVGIVTAAQLACATPVAHTQVTMTLAAGYRFTDYIKYNGIMTVIANLIMIFVTPLFLPF